MGQETIGIGSSRKIDAVFDNNGLEWYTKENKSNNVAICALLVRFLKFNAHLNGLKAKYCGGCTDMHHVAGEPILRRKNAL